MEAAKIKDRLTVVQQVYHQVAGRQPKYYDSRFHRELETHEQPYERPDLEIGEEWTPVDIGWLKDSGVGMLVIKSHAGDFPFTIPTEAEKLAESKKVVEVAVNNPEDTESILFALIYPQESVRFCPPNVSNVYIRCQSGKANVTIQAFPR